MKKTTPDFYNNDKDTERARRQAARFTYNLSFGYLLFMFILSRLMDFPRGASACYLGVIVIGSVLYFNKKLSKKVYEYWFAMCSTGLAALYALFTGRITVPLIIYFTSLCLISLFRDEKLIRFDMMLGLIFSVRVCFYSIDILNFDIKNDWPMILELSIIPMGVFSAYLTLKNLVQRDKQLFVFAQQKNRNNETLLQIVEAKREEAESAAKIKSEFLANTSHEIRTPMNSIMGMTELALREDASPQLKSYLANIRDAGTNLLNIINDILDFSKIESSKTELSVVNYSILSVINDICNIISIKMNNSNIQLITCVEPDVPATLTGDERRIKQIILNLATNAIKYTRHGSITINVSVKPCEAEGSVLLCCSVKDTGIGIREGDMKRLFNAFERADTKRNRNIEGTGLGLAICKSLTELMGGTINVRSVYGAGSVFSFEIPQAVADSTPCIKINNKENRSILLCAKAKEQAAAVSAQLTSLDLDFTVCSDLRRLTDEKLADFTDILVDYEEYVERKHLLSGLSASVTVISDPGVRLPPSDKTRKIYRPVTVISLLSLFGQSDTLTSGEKPQKIKHFSAPDAKILIVDDNSTNLLVAKRLMSLYNAQIDTAESGIIAIKMVQQNDYDIVFMDHMMPELDGIETTQAIRSLGGKYTKLVIVALSANVVSGASELFRESGMDDFIGKPIEMSELHRIFSRYIPPEKQIEGEKKNIRNEETEKSAFLDKVREIEGIQAENAFNICGRDEKVLADIIRSAATTPAIERLIKAYESKDYTNYTVYIHGLKGALRNVGMESLGNMAYDLEIAGKKKDTDYIHTHHDEFMEAFNRFAEVAIKITEKGRSLPLETGCRENLKSRIKEVIEAAKDMDYTKASKTIDNINKNTYGESTDEKISRLCEAVESFDFELAVDIGKEILGED